MLARHDLFEPASPLHLRNSSPLQPPLQICTFIFNNFQDAPPTTPFLSSFCIVARGCMESPSSGVKVLFEPSRRVSNVTPTQLGPAVGDCSADSDRIGGVLTANGELRTTNLVRRATLAPHGVTNSESLSQLGGNSELSAVDRELWAAAELSSLECAVPKKSGRRGTSSRFSSLEFPISWATSARSPIAGAARAVLNC